MNWNLDGASVMISNINHDRIYVNSLIKRSIFYSDSYFHVLAVRHILDLPVSEYINLLRIVKRDK